MSLEDKIMKIWKLVSGILSCVFFSLVTFQSCAASIADQMDEEGGVSGAAGFVVAFLMLSGGIVSIATRNSKGKGAAISLIVIFGVAALMGFLCHGKFSDLAIWSGWCLINAIFAVMDLSGNKKRIQKESAEKNTTNE